MTFILTPNKLEPTYSTRQLLAAETLGTAGLLLFGTGAAVVNAHTGGALGTGGVAAAFGLTVLLLIQTLGPVSGAHFNPVVTLAFWVSGRLAGRRVLPYWLAQATGALAGSALVRALSQALGESGSALGGTHPVAGLGAGAACGVEVGLTFWLVLVILRVARGAREQGLLAALTIGATVALAALVGGPLTGASMNPVRSLAPALFSGQWGGAWIYLVGPGAGALLAVGADWGLRPE